jgi:hypothetical protein
MAGGVASLAWPSSTEATVNHSSRRRVQPAPNPIPGGIELGPGLVIHVFGAGDPAVTLPFTGITLQGLVDFRVEWRATGPAVPRGMGDSVAPTDPGAFLAEFAPAVSTGSFSGEEIGFAFESNRGASTDPRGYAQIGTERNGVFL